MKTVVIKVDDNSSAKLFLDLAKKLNFKARVLTDKENEDVPMKPMPLKKFYKMIEESEEDVRSGKVYSHEKVARYLKRKR